MVTPVYKCDRCRKPEDEQIIIQAELQKPVVPNRNATAEAIAYIATEKYNDVFTVVSLGTANQYGGIFAVPTDNVQLAADSNRSMPGSNPET